MSLFSVVTPPPVIDDNFVDLEDVIVVDLTAAIVVVVGGGGALVVVVVVTGRVDIVGTPFRIDGVVVVLIGRLQVVLDVVEAAVAAFKMGKSIQWKVIFGDEEFN
jgi:hypothetical protein